MAIEGSGRLNTMLGQVERMLGEIRSQAPDFRYSLDLLKSDLERELSSKSKFYWSGNVDRFASRFSVLDGSFRPIVKTIGATESAKARADALKEGLRQLDATVAEHVLSKSKEWTASMDRILAEVEQSRHPDGPQRVLEQVNEELNHYEEAVQQLTLARTLIKQFGPVKTAAFQVALRELQKSFVDGRLDVAWLMEMKRHLGFLRTIADEPPPEPLAPPPSLEDCKRNVPYVRLWRRELGLSVLYDFADRLQKAEDMLNAAQAAPDIEQLAEDLRNEIADLKKIAADRREEAQTRLQEEYRYFKDCCGEGSIQANEAAKLHRLIGMSIDSPENYKDWKLAFDDASAYFLKISHLHAGELSSHLQGRINSLKGRLDAIRTLALSDEAKADADLVDASLKNLLNVPAAELLVGLRQVTSEAPSSLNARVAALEARSQNEWVEYQGEKVLMLGMVQALKAASDKVGIPVRDLTLDIEDENGRLGLSILWRRLNALTTLVADEVDVFRSACLDRAKYDLVFCREVRALLSVIVEDLPELPEGPPRMQGPLEIAAFASLCGEFRKDFGGRASTGIAALENEVGNARTELEAWVATPGYLAIEDSDAAVSWLADFLKNQASPPVAELANLRAKSNLFSRSKSLFYRQKRDAERVQRLRSELVERLQRFVHEELRRFFPEIYRRVTALVYGVDASGRQRPWAKAQLEEAQRLLELLELQARRLAAEEVAQGKAALRHLIQQTTEPARLRSLLRLAALVDGHPEDELIPLELRRQLMDLPTEPIERRAHA